MYYNKIILHFDCEIISGKKVTEERISTEIFEAIEERKVYTLNVLYAVDEDTIGKVDYQYK